ncbi:hypothetical protein TNCV_3008431 [Trichonephila clavipes]|nr:hypothetical protein TNCV_3008431 [Trichonephila clavipes]
MALSDSLPQINLGVQGGTHREVRTNSFPIRELVTFLLTWSFKGESIRYRTHRRLCSKTSQPLTSLYPATREVTNAALTPISGFKVHRVRDTNRGSSETLDTLKSFTSARETLLRASTLYNAPADANRLCNLLPDSFGPSQANSDLRASQCHPIAAFFRRDPALMVTSAALNFKQIAVVRVRRIRQDFQELTLLLRSVYR